MNKDLFESLPARAKDFASRAGLGEEVRVEVVMTTGRTFVLESVVDAADGHVQFDGWDPGAEDQRVSIVAPYYQIGSVLMMRPRKAREAGFRMRLA